MDEQSLISIIENEGLQFYDTEIANENGKNIYRVYITCKEGVTLDDCAKITNIISPLFDLNPPIRGEYFLEVSSPGIERKLKKPQHFLSSIGEMVEVRLINTDRIIGKLIEASTTSLTIQEDDNETIRLNYDDIEKAKTYVSWK